MSFSNENQSLKQLIVLGNGFDLACGLKSTYSDFFDYIYGQQMVNNTNSNNFWYKIFNNYKQDTIENWADIEEQILVQLKNIEYLYKEGFLKEEKGDSETRSLIDSRHKSGDITDNHYVTAESLLLNCYKVTSEKESQNILKNQLSILEKDFLEYLKIQIDETLYPNLFHNYYLKTLIMLCYIQCINTTKYNQSNLIFEIQSASMNSRTLQKDKFKSEISNIQSEVNNNESICLSFNYTKLMKNLNIRNIHGDLDNGNIIFGIDYDKLNKNFEINEGNSTNNKAGNDEYKLKKSPIEFSKSYRVLENGLTSTFDISSDIDIIKIYGHGLGKADYSYYQSIFDSVDLYHGKTKVMFFWSDYEGKEKEKIHKNFVKGVTNLIEEYGTTFTNKDHGRNLFTKLLLENRLTIEEIPVNALFLNV